MSDVTSTNQIDPEAMTLVIIDHDSLGFGIRWEITAPDGRHRSEWLGGGNLSQLAGEYGGKATPKGWRWPNPVGANQTLNRLQQAALLLFGGV